MNQDVAARYIEALPRLDVREFLARVHAPALLMHRRGDRYTPLSAGQAVASALADARMVIFEGDNPLLPPDQDRVSTLVSEFLDGAKPAPAPPVAPPPRAIDTTPGIRYATGEGEVRYCTTEDGVRIAYVDIGEGFPFVFLPGWTAPVAKALDGPSGQLARSVVQGGQRFIRFDPRGTGSSDRRVDEVSLAAQLRDLDAVVRHCGIDRMVLMAGRHMSHAAIAFAAQHQDKVTRLILQGPYPNGDECFRRSRFWTALQGIRQSGDLETYADLFHGVMGGGPKGANVRDVISPATLAAYEDAFRSSDVSDLLPGVAAPTLVIHPSTFDSASVSREVAANIRDARVVFVDAADPSEQERAIANFLQSFRRTTAPAPPVAPPPRAIDTTPGIRYATSADGTKIAYEVYGGGPGVPLVIISAWWASSNLGFADHPVIRELSEERPVVLYTNRGIGLSTRDVSDVSVAARASDLDSLLAALGAAQVDLFCVSDGAPVGLTYAAGHPDRVRKLAFWGGFTRGSEFIRPEGAQRLVSLIRTDWSLARRNLATSTLSSNSPGDAVRRGAANLREIMSQEMAAMYIEAIAASDATSVLPRVTMPVLVLHRRNDTYDPFAAGQALASALPNARFLPVDGDSPVWHPEDGELIAGPIIEFLDGAKPEPVRPEAATISTPGIRYVNSADGARIAYMTMGNGRPLLFALPYPTSIELDWELPQVRAFFEGLLPGRMIVRYDMRGTASSQRDVTDSSPERQADDLLAVADALKLDRFDVFAGPGPGAHAALIVAARHPERIERLILWEPAPLIGPWPQDEEAKAWRLLVSQNWRGMTRTIADSIAPSAPLDVKRFLTRLYRETMTPEVYLRDAPSDVQPLLPDVRSQTLVLHARDDAQIPLDTSRDTVAAMPDARLVTIEGNSAYFFLYHEQIVPVMREFLGDEPIAHGQPTTPSGVHTILFTDIVSSTALTQRLGDAQMQELVRAHDSIVREALTTYGGREIKHTGDGIMASFGTASAALECAVAIQRAVERGAHGHAPLQVHVGLNAGEPVVEGDDLFGASVQLARRLCDHSEAGQIVVSDVVRQLALGKGFSFSPLPEAELKGFDEPIRAYELAWRQEERPGPDGLTAREVEVLRLIAAGRTNTEIADELTLSVRTVARHITNIYTKIGARNKAEATDYVHRQRLS
jgi:pimeloyl-ACP methyl ester carboxylesterase/class 3 adenylate cyclase